ncbi:DNA repair protein rhp16, putative [Babesia caballi]|uniref:DNA repair protein rhp16, putative n=1 Tax=Babesia caballi TaxID=5871 RepID=A0AAV4LN98_BABCB|nr:DNA repair protein rhp16, putative [Babesia caballi]
MADSNAIAAFHTPNNRVYVNCLLDVKHGAWMAPITAEHFEGRRRSDIREYKCVIRKFNRSYGECRMCRELINKNEVVVGLPIKDLRGTFGYSTLWHHVTCAVPILNRLIGLKDSIQANKGSMRRRSKKGGRTPASNDQDSASRTNAAKTPTRGRKKSAKVDCNTSGEDGIPSSAPTADASNADPSPEDESKRSAKISNAAETKDDPASDGEAMDEETKVIVEQLKAHAFGFEALGKARNQVLHTIQDALKREHSTISMPEIADASETPKGPPKLEALPQPPELLVPLLPFQKDGVTWMYHQEKGPMKGGILADEMGMGKTIQAVALLVTAKRESLKAENTLDAATSKPETKSNAASSNKADKDNESAKRQEGVTYKPETHPEGTSKKRGKDAKKIPKNTTTLNRKGCTLIVSPLAALLQWYNEIKSKVQDGCLSVLLYHGKHRKDLAHVLHEYDVVLTTYSIVETDFRRVVNQNKVACQYCGRIFLPKTLVLHQKYFCGPFATRTEKQRLSERKRDSNPSSFVLKIHARLFPDIKKVVDEINSANAANDDDAPVKEVVTEHVVDAFTTFGLNEDEVEHALESLQDGLPEFLAHLKKLAVDAKLPNMGNFEMLERFAETKTLDLSFFKSVTVAELRDLLGAFGLGPYGIKAQLINKVIVFINKLRQLGQHLHPSPNAAVASKHASTGDARLPETTENVSSTEAVATSESTGMKNFVSKKKIIDLDDSPEDQDALSPTDAVIPDVTPSAHACFNTEANAFSNDSETDEETDSVASRKRLRRSTADQPEETATRRVATRSLAAKSRTEASKVKKEPGSTADGEHLDSKRTPIKEEAGRAHATKYKPLKTELPEAEKKTPPTAPTPKVTPEKVYEGSALHEVIWDRIIIDEAHRIKTKSNSTSQAILSLRSSGSRWCLTGTPLQNRVGDVYSLISFLKMHPYAYIICNKDGCHCESIEFLCEDFKRCDLCGHSRVNHYSYFNKRILKPILTHGYTNEGQVAMQELQNDVLAKIMLRRTKLEKADDVKLPPMHVTIRRDALSLFERDFYESIYKQSTVQFDTYVKSGTLLHNYAHIFDLLTRLRQAVDHPYLILYGPSSLAVKASSTPDPQAKAELEATVNQALPAAGTERNCGICFDLLPDEAPFLTSNCKHTFHPQCLNGYLESRPADILGDAASAATCPACYAPLTVALRHAPEERPDPAEGGDRAGSRGVSRSSILQRFKLSEFKSSTKIEALFAEVSQILTATTDKCLVFSQYCSMLELIAFRFRSASVPCAVLVGSTSIDARRNVLLEFHNNPGLRVLLISLMAGGEGLNLQIANRIFLMDPWWNPASELQAIQRAHRIGQTKPVHAVRFICRDTIEERIIELQEKKMIVFDATISASSSSMARLSSADLSFLFRR